VSLLENKFDYVGQVTDAETLKEAMRFRSTLDNISEGNARHIECRADSEKASSDGKKIDIKFVQRVNMLPPGAFMNVDGATAKITYDLQMTRLGNDLKITRFQASVYKEPKQ
jgi:hypothetical protein